MKVILLKDVAKIGRKGSVIEVSDGYAQNKLLPNKMAKPATTENLKLAVHSKEKLQAFEAQGTLHFHEMLKKLEGQVLTVGAETNAQGHMFEALKAGAVSAVLAQMLAVNISAENVTMPVPIKSVGEHKVLFSLGKNKKEISINVVSKISKVV